MPTNRLPRSERRAQLLECALEMFGANGYHETSMVDVASHAGVTKPVLYQHFTSKHELFAEVLRLAGADMEQRFADAVQLTMAPRERVEAGFRAFIDFYSDRPMAFRVLFGEASHASPEFIAVTRRLETVIAEQIAVLITTKNTTEADRLLLAHAILGLVHGVSRHWLDTEGPPDRAHAARLMTDLAWLGLRGELNERQPISN